jgi:hypothetical protein
VGVNRPTRAMPTMSECHAIEDSFAGRSADEITSLLDQVGIASARMRTPEEFTRHPQLRPQPMAPGPHPRRRHRRARAAG